MRNLLFVVALAVPVAASAGLPIRPGTYVQIGTPCRDAPFAAMKSYDGHGLGDPHDAQCRSSIVSHEGDRYTVHTICRANGDGSSTRPTTEVATLRFPSHTAFVFAAEGAAQPGTTFRLCPAAKAVR